ncbi:MAG: hypothetical protein PHY02_03165 [Phycisphaerae bacterium]|nr:hypothetical protein [Phycisphaerae bacterium]
MEKRNLMMFVLVFTAFAFFGAVEANGARKICYHVGPFEVDSNTAVHPSDPRWTEWTTSAAGPADLNDLDANTIVTIAVTNNEDPMRYKEFTITITGTDIDFYETDVNKIGATKIEGKGEVEVFPSNSGVTVSKSRYELSFSLSQQPRSEWFQVVTKSDHVNLNRARAATRCNKLIDRGWPNYFGRRVTMNSILDSAAEPIRITEFWFFPEEFSIDTGVEPNFIGPPGSGNWTYQWVCQDPNGNPMPNCGVKWTTDGIGISNERDYTMSFCCTERGLKTITSFLYDADAVFFDPYIFLPMIVPDCTEIPGNLNDDCYINFQDLAILAENWIECNHRLDPSCTWEP